MSFKKCAVIFSLASSALMASAPAMAQSQAAGSGPNPFTDCGIGAALFTETKWAAVTSNIIWDIGITAMISATASPQTCSGKKVTAALFIRDSYDKLAEETASGKGEHLTVAMEMLGCADSAHAAVAQQVRSDMAMAVSAPGYASAKPLDKAAAFYTMMDKAVTANCAA